MVLKSPPRSVHYTVLVCSEYNISQYIHMYDKGWRLSDFCSAFLHLDLGGSTMPLHLQPKRPPYVVFFRVVWNCLSLTFLFRFFETKNSAAEASGKTETKTGLAWCKHLPELGRSCNQIGRTWSLLACPEGFLTRVLLQLRVVLERGICVVSACFINVLYFLCCIFLRSKISWSIVFL